MERINFNKIKCNEGAVERRYTFLSILLDLLVRCHKIVSSHVNNISNLQIVNKRINEPKGRNTLSQINEMTFIATSEWVAKRQNFTLLAWGIFLIFNCVFCFAIFTSSIVLICHCFIVNILSHSCSVRYLVLENLERILVVVCY